MPSFRKPKPNFPLMWVLGAVNRWFMLRGLPVLRWIPVVRDLRLVRGHFHIRTIDFPPADRARLRGAVNPGTAAFIGPNHPEFGFDWMMDKEVSTDVSPRMASWASHEIVATAPWFWLRNNLISHNGGEAAIEYSVAWARRGHGVLLHPEGSVHWTADRIHPLFHGIAEMACEAARAATGASDERPVYIVPIVWKLQHIGDVSQRLHAEMGRIERHFDLKSGDDTNVAERFRLLQEGVLQRRMQTFGFDAVSLDRCDFFFRQDAFRHWLMDDLSSRYPVEKHDSIERTLTRFKRVISAARRALQPHGSSEARCRYDALTMDLDRAEEASRLGGFSGEVYGRAQLSQEQIGESLKRHRATLVTGGLGNTIHNFLPTPFGARVVHVRVPEPIQIDVRRALGSDDERQVYVSSLIETARTRMQEALDSINREVSTEVARFSVPNPFLPAIESTEERLGDEHHCLSTPTSDLRLLSSTFFFLLPEGQENRR